jgi:hypothetical protein
MKMNRFGSTARKAKALHGAPASTGLVVQQTLPKPLRLKKTPHKTCAVQRAACMVASANVETRGKFRLSPLSSEMLTLEVQVQTLSQPRNPRAAK